MRYEDKNRIITVNSDGLSVKDSDGFHFHAHNHNVRTEADLIEFAKGFDEFKDIIIKFKEGKYDTD